jgi:hypothetical protein
MAAAGLLRSAVFYGEPEVHFAGKRSGRDFCDIPATDSHDYRVGGTMALEVRRALAILGS